MLKLGHAQVIALYLVAIQRIEPVVNPRFQDGHQLAVAKVKPTLVLSNDDSHVTQHFDAPYESFWVFLFRRDAAGERGVLQSAPISVRHCRSSECHRDRSSSVGMDRQVDKVERVGSASHAHMAGDSSGRVEHRRTGYDRRASLPTMVAVGWPMIGVGSFSVAQGYAGAAGRRPLDAEASKRWPPAGTASGCYEEIRIRTVSRDRALPGVKGGTRTPNQLIMSQLLYPLSYFPRCEVPPPPDTCRAMMSVGTPDRYAEPAPLCDGGATSTL